MSAAALGRVLALLRADVRLQLRHGFYAAYAVVSLAYILILRGAPPDLARELAPVLIATDPSVLGFFFLGALMLLEKVDGVRAALGATPVRAAEYLAAKIASLTLLALLAVAAIAALSRLPSVDWAQLLLASAATSAMFVALGAPIALRSSRVSGYLVGSAVFLTPVLLPAIAAYWDVAAPWRLYPPLGAYGLIRGALGAPLSAAEIAWSSMGLALGVVGATIWAIRALEKER